jgi:hypothetical protein
VLSAVASADPAGVLLGSWWRLCGSAEVLGGLWGEGLMLPAHKTPPRFSLVMTRNDDFPQNAVTTQKLEWVTPKISLMEAGETDGNKDTTVPNEQTLPFAAVGPS